MREPIEERNPRMERSPGRTLKELLEQAPSDLESLEVDIEGINKETPPDRIKIFLEEAGYDIKWLKEMGEELINKGIKLRKDGTLSQGEEEIWIGFALLTTGLKLHEKIIKSGGRVEGFTEKVRLQKEELREYLRRFLYLVLKVEILGYENTPSSEIEREGIRSKREEIRKRLEESLVETGKEKKRVREELDRQIKKWKKELKKQIH